MQNYIPHPSNSRQASLIVRLLIEEGYAGYGIYWAILEILRDAPGYRYSPFVKVWKFLLPGTDEEQLQRILSSYELFQYDDDGLLYSPWLLEQLSSYDEQKKKLQEAGRKGAAKRWASANKDDGKAIATPSMDDGKAIASNMSHYIVSKHDVTNESNDGQDIVDSDYMDILSRTATEGHAPGYVAQVCIHYGMKRSTCDAICERSENARVGNSTYKAFVALVARIQREKWVPKHPDAFFLAKLFPTAEEK